MPVDVSPRQRVLLDAYGSAFSQAHDTSGVAREDASRDLAQAWAGILSDSVTPLHFRIMLKECQEQRQVWRDRRECSRRYGEDWDVAQGEVRYWERLIEAFTSGEEALVMAGRGQ